VERGPRAQCVQEHNAIFPGRAQTEMRAQHLWFIFIISKTLLAFEPTSPSPSLPLGFPLTFPGVGMDILRHYTFTS